MPGAWECSGGMGGSGVPHSVPSLGHPGSSTFTSSLSPHTGALEQVLSPSLPRFPHSSKGSDSNGSEVLWEEAPSAVSVPGMTVQGLWWPPKAPLPKEAPLRISLI